MPIAQQLISNQCGAKVLRDIVDLMIVPKPDKNQSPFQKIKLMKLEDKLLRQIFLWVEKSAATNLTLSNLATQLIKTERTLSKNVKTKTQMFCARFMRLIKLHQTSEHLINGNQSINVISHQLGYSDDPAFRRTFKIVTDYTPGEYRQLFGR